MTPFRDIREHFIMTFDPQGILIEVFLWPVVTLSLTLLANVTALIFSPIISQKGLSEKTL